MTLWYSGMARFVPCPKSRPLACLLLLAALGGVGASLYAGVTLDSVSNTGNTVYSGGENVWITSSEGGAHTADSAFGAFSSPSGNNYVFGWANKATPGAVADFDLTGKTGASDTYTFNFTFSGGEGLSYIAYTGGALTSLRYSFDNPTGPSGNGTDGGTLTMSFASTTAARSASNATGGQTLFGFSLVTSHNTATQPYYSAAAFRTDMYWGDISLQQTGGDYGDTTGLVGANFDGLDGNAANFSFYVADDVLRGLVGTSATLSSLDQSAFAFNKADSADSFVLGSDVVNIDYHTNGVVEDYNALFAAGADTEHTGTSTFNFGAAGGNDNYVVFSFSNDQWSDANIVLSAVPEPAHYAAIVSALGLLGALYARHRSRA